MAEGNQKRHSALFMDYRTVHKITHLRSASLLRASVKQKVESIVFMGQIRFHLRFLPSDQFRSNSVLLLPAINTENIHIFTGSVENLIICWKGGAEGKGESVIVYSHVFSNRG